jgi:hypothetical protein
MARIKTPFPISGPLGDLVFAAGAKKTTIRLRPYTNKQRWLTHPRFLRSRENAQSFGGASKTACAIYSAIARNQKELLLPYSHNKLIRRLRATAKGEARAIDRYNFKNAYPALRNLDMSHEEAPISCIQFTPLGPAHHPDSLRIKGFQDCAETFHLNGNGRLEVRLQIHHVPFPETQYDPELRKWSFTPEVQKLRPTLNKSEWIPVQILPKEGLKLLLSQEEQTPTPPDTHSPNTETKLPSAPTPPNLIFVLVEWREVREVDDEIKPMPEKTIARLAAMQYSAELAAEMAQDEKDTAEEALKHQPAKPSLPDWKTNPQAYLAAALTGMVKPPDIPSQLG